LQDPPKFTQITFLSENKPSGNPGSKDQQQGLKDNRRMELELKVIEAMSQHISVTKFRAIFFPRLDNNPV
jgi:hypothetical protein